MPRGLARLALLTFGLATSAFAQTASVMVIDAPGVNDGTVRRLQKSAAELLKQTSAWSVSDPPEWKKSAPRKKCDADDLKCLREVTKAAGAPVLLLLWLRSADGGVSADGMLWLDSEKSGAPKSAEVQFETLEASLRPLVEGLLPAWARRGWGGVRWPDAEVVTLKVDGRAVQRGKTDVVPVPSGPHQLDVVYADGRAVLQQVDVAEGARTRVEVAAAPELGSLSVSSGGNDKLRYASYGLFVAGAAAVATGFIVGFAGRQTAVGANPCRPDSRECLTYEQAAERNRAAEAYARTGNIVLAIGFSVMFVGAGLFTFDALFR